MSLETKEGENPRTLKGEAPVEVAVLAVQEHDSDDDEISPSPIEPTGRRGSGWGNGLMKSARSSIEQPRSWAVDPEEAESCSRTPPLALVNASRSFHTSQWRNNTPVNAVHVVDLNLPAPTAEALAAKPTYAGEVDAAGKRAHAFLASRNERVKAVLGIVGKDDLADGEKRERVRIVCKSDHWTASASIVQRFPVDQPFTLTVTSQHQQVFIVLPRSFRGVVRLSTTNASGVQLSPAVGAAYTHVGKELGFVGEIEGWSRDPAKVDEEGLDECVGSSGPARVHVRFEDEPEELDPLEEAAKEAAKAAKKVTQKVSSWWKSAVDSL